MTKGVPHVDAFRRGWVGLALFFSALVLMPILVLEFRGSEAGGSELTAAESAAARQETPAPGAGTPTSAVPGVLVRFDGIVEGAYLHDFQRITLVTMGDVDGIVYTLTGPTGKQYIVNAPEPPYTFAPHPNGWETTEVINGPYSLKATAGNPGINPATISFWIYNTSANSGQPS
ncbi:hypothetical protein UG55_106612 [Frankia sp. EI5c]|uniref:hypothetical protein n=1 Tax=Frankia sp. EI5c TaxID=683316 RepID=UPI0007C271B0|nr:hypothetical protein [Frankia sp. EI5c]OAA20976.1 hypothetical protein UG55_106612 [Frankia sp. EI5c]